MVPNDLKRWGLTRTPQNGVSVGYTSIKTFRRCMRYGFWSRLAFGQGLTHPAGPPSLPALYGRAWHRAFCASYKNEPIKESLQGLLDEEGLEAFAYQVLMDEVQRDLDWYWNQADRGDENLTVLACEEELRVQVGRHELRGTPDLIGRTPSGTILNADHKTFGILSFGKGGSPRITIHPKENTVLGYQTSRQFVFYSYLWNLAHPETPCYEAVLNLVPSHVTQVLDILGNRKGNVEYPRVHRVDLEPYAPSYIAEVGAQALRLCDAIAAWWDEYEDPNTEAALNEALLAFPENEAACTSYGKVCDYSDLCRSAWEERKYYLREAYKIDVI